MESITGWRKPSRSQGSGNCVEVGSAPSIVGVRDTKDRHGATLAMTTGAWSRFVRAIKAGELDAD